MSPESVDSTKRSPATVHNRKSLPNFRVWGHDFPKDRAQHGKTCKPQKGQSPTPGKHARRRRARGRTTRQAHHGNARVLIALRQAATTQISMEKSDQALLQLRALSPFAASKPYFALAASHAAEASRAQASISASWSRLSTFCRPPPCPASCASIMAPTQPSISR